MIIGIPQEVKSDEYRIGLQPVGIEMLTARGHRVLVESGAGVGAGFPDDEYVAAGAEIAATAADVWAAADMIVKVKEPQPAEWPHMREGQYVFTYFHFAADRDLTLACLEKKIVAIA